MLVGQPPFVSEGFGELVNMHLNVQPPPPRSKRPEIPLALDALVLKMLAKNPEERYAGDGRAAGGAEVVGRQPSRIAVVARPRRDARDSGDAGVADVRRLHDTTFSTGRRRARRRHADAVGGRGKMVAGVDRGGGDRRRHLLVAEATSTGQGADEAGGRGAAQAGHAPTADAPVAPVAPRRRRRRRRPCPRSKKIDAAPRLRCRRARKVVDDVDGELLGVTPLVLTRPRGGTLTLRFEKDGYGASTRTMPLDGDQAFELTLEQQKAKKKAHKTPREREPATSEPANHDGTLGGSRPPARARGAALADAICSLAMVRQGARASLILAFVFPAIVCAAVALAYYGYRYAVAASVRSKASLMEGNQQLAQLLIEQIQDRIDKVDAELFEEVEWDDPAADPPSSFELPAGVESVVRARRRRSRSASIDPAPDPARRRRELERWQGLRAGPRLEVAASPGRRTRPGTSATCTSCSRASRC